jgi:hypothetical protein
MQSVLVTKFTNALVKSRPIGGLGGEQVGCFHPVTGHQILNQGLVFKYHWWSASARPPIVQIHSSQNSGSNRYSRLNVSFLYQCFAETYSLWAQLSS